MKNVNLSKINKIDEIQKIILVNGIEISIYHKDLMTKYSGKFIQLYKNKKEMYKEIEKILKQKNKILKIL